MPTMAELRQAEERKAREAAEAARRAPVAPPAPRYVPPAYVPPANDDTDYFDSLGAAAASQQPADNRSRAPAQGERIAAAYYIPQDPVVVAQNLQASGHARVPYGYFENVDPQRQGGYFGNEGQQPGYFGQGFSDKEQATRTREGRLQKGERPRGGTFEGGQPVPNADVWNRAELNQTVYGQNQPGATPQYGGYNPNAGGNTGAADVNARAALQKTMNDQYPGKPEGWGLPEKPNAAPPPGYEWVFGGQVIRPGGPGSQPMFQDAAGRWLLQKVVQTTAGGGGTGGGGGGGYAQKPYQSYGYGGYAGGAGAGVAPEVPEPMGELAWWGPDALPPLLRQWGSWLQELVAANAGTKPIPFPLQQDPEALAAEQEMLKEGQKTTGAPAPGLGAGGMTYSQVIQQLNNSLGLAYGDDESDTSKWQRLVSSLPNSDFETQQMVAGLRFNQSGQWYHQNVGQMLNPRYT